MISGLFINFFFFDRTFRGDSYYLSNANRALQGSNEASTTSWMTGGLGRSLAVLVTTLSGSFLRTLDIGDRHGARGPMGEHPGGDMLNNFLHF